VHLSRTSKGDIIMALLFRWEEEKKRRVRKCVVSVSVSKCVGKTNSDARPPCRNAMLEKKTKKKA
jgi:hypothetical protein